MTNVEPPEEIPPNWRTTFRGQYRDCVSSRLEYFHEEEEEDYREDLERDISNDKHHRELVNLCVFPFAEHRPKGYEFIRGDPLYELGEPNFDFLLWDFEGHAVFGEAKANISEGREGDAVNEVLDQIEAVEKHEDYIIEKYLGSAELKHKEYVLAAFYPDADRVTKKIIAERENIVTWRVHQMDKVIRINSPAPPRDDWMNDPDEYYDLIQHSHSDLNSALERLKSSTECFDLFPKSFPVTELHTLISASHKIPPKVFVDEDSVIESVEESLFYLSESEQHDTAKQILSLGISIGFLEEWDDSEGDFKIVSRYTRSDGLEKTLAKKWIDHKVEERENEIKDGCWDEVRERILEKSKPQTKLTDYS